MSLSTFRLAEIATAGELAKGGEKITAVAVFKTNIYVGTRSGNIFLYTKASHAAGSPASSPQSAGGDARSSAQAGSQQESKSSGVGAGIASERYELVCTKSIASKKPIEQLITSPGLGLLIVLCDGRVTFYELYGLKRKAEKDEIPNAGLICVDHTTNGRYLAVVHSKKKKLMLFCHNADKDKYEVMREFAIPDAPHSMLWTERAICLGYRRAYTLLAVETGSVVEIAVPLDGATPCMVSVASNELLVTREDLGFFMIDNGDLAARNSVSFRSPPRALALCGQYVVTLCADGGVDIFAHVDSKLIQSVPASKCPGLSVIGASSDAVALCSEEKLYLLSLASLEEQVTQYIEKLLIDQAVGLLKRSPRVTDADIDRLHLRAAVAHLYALRFRAAFAHFLRAKTAPALVLELFPDLPLRHAPILATRCKAVAEHSVNANVVTFAEQMLRITNAILTTDKDRESSQSPASKYVGFVTRDPFFPPEGVTMWDIIRVGRRRVIRDATAGDDESKSMTSDDSLITFSWTSMSLPATELTTAAFSYPIQQGLPISGLYAYARLALAKDFLWRLRQPLPSLPSLDPNSTAARPTLVEQLDYALLILATEFQSPTPPIFLHPESRNTPKKAAALAAVGERALYDVTVESGSTQRDLCAQLLTPPLSPAGAQLTPADRVLLSQEVIEFLMLHDDVQHPAVKAVETLMVVDGASSQLIHPTDTLHKRCPRPHVLPALHLTVARLAVHDILRFVGPPAIALPFDTGLTSASPAAAANAKPARGKGGVGAQTLKSQASKSRDSRNRPTSGLSTKWPWSRAQKQPPLYLESAIMRKRRQRLKRMHKLIALLTADQRNQEIEDIEDAKLELATLIAYTEEELEMAVASDYLPDGSDEGIEDPRVEAENNLVAGYVPDDRTVSGLTLACGSLVPLSPFSGLFHSRTSDGASGSPGEDTTTLSHLCINSAAFRHCTLPFNARDVVFKSTLAATVPLLRALTSLAEVQNASQLFAKPIDNVFIPKTVKEALSIPIGEISTQRTSTPKPASGIFLMRHLMSLDMSLLTPLMFLTRQHMLLAHTLFVTAAYLRAAAILVQGQEQAQRKLQLQQRAASTPPGQASNVEVEGSPLGVYARQLFARHDDFIHEALAICAAASCGDFPRSPRDAISVSVTPWSANVLGAASLQGSSVPLIFKRIPFTQYDSTAATVDTASFVTLLRSSGTPKTPVISGVLVLSLRDLRNYDLAIEAALPVDHKDGEGHSMSHDDADDNDDDDDGDDDDEDLIDSNEDEDESDAGDEVGDDPERTSSFRETADVHKSDPSDSLSREFEIVDVSEIDGAPGSSPKPVNASRPAVHPLNQFSVALAPFAYNLVKRGLEIIEGDVALLVCRIQARQRARARILTKLVPGLREGLHTLSQQAESELLWTFLPWLSLCAPVDAARALTTSSHKLGPRRQLHPIKAVLVLRAAQLVSMKYHGLLQTSLDGNALDSLNPIEGALNRAYQSCASTVAPLLLDPVAAQSHTHADADCLLQGVPAKVPLTRAVASAEAVISAHVAPFYRSLSASNLPKFRSFGSGGRAQSEFSTTSPSLAAAIFVGVDAAQHYLEHIVHHTDAVSSTTAVHDLLGQNYLTTLSEFFATKKQLLQASGSQAETLCILEALLTQTREKFQRFLKVSSHYDVPALVAATAPFASELVAERIILNAKAGQHAEVLRTYLLKLNQPANAESYCTYVLGVCAERILNQQRAFHQQQLEQEKQQKTQGPTTDMTRQDQQGSDERNDPLSDPVSVQDMNVAGTLLEVILSPEHRAKFPLTDAELADDARRAAAFRRQQLQKLRQEGEDDYEDVLVGTDAAGHQACRPSSDPETKSPVATADEPEAEIELPENEGTKSLTSQLTARGSTASKPDSWRTRLLHILDKFAAFIDPVLVAAKVPPEVPLDLLLPYFENTLGEIDLTRRSARLARALARMLYLRTKLDLLHARSAHITLTNEDCCPECLKPLGDKTVLVVISLASLVGGANKPLGFTYTRGSRAQYAGLPGHVAAAVAMMRHREFGDPVPSSGLVQNACGILVTNTAEHVVVHHNCIRKFIKHVQAKLSRI